MRRTLIDLIQKDISRSDDPRLSDRGPDWLTVVEDAVLAQDMQWLADAELAASDGGDLAPVQQLRLT